MTTTNSIGNQRELQFTAHEPDEEFDFRVTVLVSEIAAYCDYSAMYPDCTLLHLKSGRSFLIKVGYDDVAEIVAQCINGWEDA